MKPKGLHRITKPKITHKLKVLLVDGAIEPQGFPIIRDILGRGLLRHQESRRVSRSVHEEEDDYTDHDDDDDTLNQTLDDKPVHPSHHSHRGKV